MGIMLAVISSVKPGFLPQRLCSLIQKGVFHGSCDFSSTQNDYYPTPIRDVITIIR